MRIHAHSMLGVSRIWMDDDSLAGELAAHPLGSAAAGQLEVIHGRLATALEQRFLMEQRLGELTESIAGAANRFARKGRALHSAFDVLAGFTDDAAQEARYRKLQTLLFPDGLRIFQRTHLEGTGAVELARKQVTPAVLDELAAITLAGRTVSDLYREWVDAGQELGRYLSERTRTREALRRKGSKAAGVDIKAARAEWVRLVRMLLTIADMIGLSDSAREGLLGPLRRAVIQVAGPSLSANHQTDEADQDAAGALPAPVNIQESKQDEDRGAASASATMTRECRLRLSSWPGNTSTATG